MEKAQILSFIKSQLATGAITEADIRDLSAGSHTSSVPGHSSRMLINSFYAIGGVIALVGIIILVSEHWLEIGFIGRVLVTLGISALTFMLGIVFRDQSKRVMSQIFFVLSASLLPMGAYVTLTEQGMGFGPIEQIIVSLLGVFVYGIAWLVNRRHILPVLMVLFGTWTYWAVIYKFLPINGFNTELYTWAAIILGACYVLLGIGYRGTAGEDKDSALEVGGVKNFLYFFGTLAVLGGGSQLKGMWELLYFIPLFGAFYLSVFIRSRLMLVLAALFLIGHLVVLTSKYFANTIGWPVTLIVCGFLIIGIGYGTYYIHKKYLSTK